ncbi:MAG: cobalamin-dependent protein [Methanococcaceae archaeon]
MNKTNNMKEVYISTKEVASLLNVTETTIKRWTDTGSINCVKTLGGHRKYLIEDIEQFAKSNNIPFTGASLSSEDISMERLGYAVYTNNLSSAADMLFEEALYGNRDSIFELLMFLHRMRIKFSDIIDQVIFPAMFKVGEMWEKNKLKIEQEHLITDTIKTALARIIVYLPKQPQKNIKVVCACTQGEHHDIGLQALAYELELSGYKIHYLGADTPFESMVSVIKKETPQFMCISATAPHLSKKDLVKGVNTVTKAARRYKTKVITGGIYFQNFDKNILGSDIVVKSIKETISYIKANNKER